MFVWLKFLAGVHDYDDLLNLMLEQKVTAAPGMHCFGTPLHSPLLTSRTA